MSHAQFLMNKNKNMSKQIYYFSRFTPSQTDVYSQGYINLPEFYDV